MMPPQNQEPQIPSPNSAPNAGPAPQTPSGFLPTSMPGVPGPAPKSNKRILVTGVIILLVIIAGLVYFLTKHNKTTTSNSAPVTSSQAAQSTNTTKTPASTTAPTGWVTKQRKCFTIALPPDNDLSDSDNSCIISTYYGSDKVAGFSTVPFVYSNETVATDVSKWKDFYKDYKIVSETDVKVDGLAAHKIVYVTSAVNNDTWVIFFVDTSSKKYLIENVPASGFEIIGRYDSQYSSKTDLDLVIANWHWN